MKKLFNVMALALILVSALMFGGCKDKTYSVYIFTSTGGYVTVGDSADKISLKEILYYEKEVNLTLTAHENEGNQFLYWTIDTKVYSSEKTINLDIEKETVIKAMFETSNTMSITFVDENNNMLTDTPLAIGANEIMTNFPQIPPRDGYIGNFYCGNDKMVEGAVYPYSTSKTFVLKYVKQSYNVYIQCVDCVLDQDVFVSLVSGYTWTVDHNQEVKFTVTSSKIEFDVYLGNQENQLNANAYGVYTISNITNDKVVIIKLKQVIDNTPPVDDGEQDSGNENAGNEGTTPDTDPDLDPTLEHCTISFDYSIMPKNITVKVESEDFEYDLVDNKYEVYKYLSFEFSLEDSAIYKADYTYVYANGEMIAPDNDGIYKLTNILEDIEIDIEQYYTMNLSINYGQITTINYEDLIDGDVLPYYSAYVSIKHDRISNHMASLDKDTDLITFTINNQPEHMTITEFINYVNSTIETDSQYKIAKINLLNSVGEQHISDWAKVSYDSNGVADITLASTTFTHLSSYYTLSIEWDKVENLTK